MGRFNAIAAAAAKAAAPEPQLPSVSVPHLVVLTPPAPPQGTPSKPKAKLDFGGIKKKETAAAPSSEYPVLPDPDGSLATQASAFLKAHAAEAAATGAKEAARGVLVAAARPFHFSVNSGRAEIPSSVSIPSPDGEVRVTFKDAYKKLDEVKYERVAGLIGEELAGAYLTQTFEFTINSEKIPEEKMQAVIDAINEMAVDLGVESAVSVATCYKPNAEWHSARFRKLSPEQNLELERLIDSEKGFCTAAVGPARGKGKS
jgi:hypothetical protein